MILHNKLIDKTQGTVDQAEIEVRRLKAELERVSEKQRESLAEQSRRVAEVERRYTSQTEQLSADLAAQWDNATKLSLELEKQRRVESDLRRELAQRNSTIDELKKEFNAKTSKFKQIYNADQFGVWLFYLLSPRLYSQLRSLHVAKYSFESNNVFI